MIFGLICIKSSQPALAADGALDVAPKESEAPNAPALSKVRLYGASKALVIGIDNYGASGWSSPGGGGWPKLSMAIKDAEAVRDALKTQGFTVTLLKDLTSADLDRVLKEFFVKEGADPEARLFVWFAGHGHTVGGEGYIVPADAPDPNKSDVDFRLKALSLRRFGEYMRDAKAKHVLAVFDSCFGGAVFNVARDRPPAAITYVTAQPVRQFASSGEAEQTVSDNGKFRRLFVDAIEGKETAADPNGDGYVTGAELGQFLFDKVTNYTNKRQTPRWGKLNEQGYDRGDFVFEKGKLEAPPHAPSGGASKETAAGTGRQTPGSDAAEPAPAQLLSEAAQAWPLIKDSEDVAVLEAFAKQYGSANAFYGQLAASRIAALKQRTAKEEADGRAKAAAEAEARAKADEAANAKAAEKGRGQPQSRRGANNALRRDANKTKASGGNTSTSRRGKARQGGVDWESIGKGSEEDE